MCKIRGGNKVENEMQLFKDRLRIAEEESAKGKLIDIDDLDEELDLLLKERTWEVCGKDEPYTVEEIAETPCVRCGNPSYTTWQICSDGKTYRPLCKQCDIELNKLVLEWMNLPGKIAKINYYIKSMEE
jgi:hypothetical protein